MARAKILKKVAPAQSPKPTPRVTMSGTHHRMILNRIDAARAILVNVRKELEVKYVNVAVEMAFNPKPMPPHVEAYMMLCQAHTAIQNLNKALEALAADEHPSGIPSTV